MSNDLKCYENFCEIDKQLSREKIEIKVYFDDQNLVEVCVYGDSRKTYNCIVSITPLISTNHIKFTLKPNSWINDGWTYSEKVEHNLKELEFIIALQR